VDCACTPIGSSAVGLRLSVGVSRGR
jgi:hypothetical protein